MKKAVAAIFTMLSLATTSTYAQDTIQLLQNIETFADQSFSSFVVYKSNPEDTLDIDDQNSALFYIFLRKQEFQNVKVFTQSQQGERLEINPFALTGEDQNDNVTAYKIKDAIQKNGLIELLVCKTVNSIDECITLKFFIDESKQLINKEKGVCELPDIANAFGEMKTCSSYDKDKIVYVFDFRTKATYKITRNCKDEKGKCLLKVTSANLSKETLTPKNSVTFKIVNINKFIYKSTITNTDVVFDSEPNALFNQIFIGDSSLLGDLLSVFGSSIVESPNAVKAESFDPKNSALNTALVKLRGFMSDYNRLHSKVLKAYDPCNDFDCCLEIEREDYQKLANKLLDVKIQLALVQAVMNDKTEQLKVKQNEIKDCEKNNAEAAETQKQIEAIEKIKEQDRTDKNKKDLADLQAKKGKIKTCSDPDIIAKKAEASSMEAEVKSFSIITEINAKLPLEQELRKLVVFINNVASLNQEHILGPISPYGNRFDLSVKFEPRAGILEYMSLPFDKDSIAYQIPVIKKSFISFSAGTLISLSDRLQNKTYQWQQVPELNNTVSDTSRYILSESGYSQHVMGFAALANAEWKLSRSFGIGFSFGAGLTIESEPRPSYLGGASIFFGDLRQLTLTCGLLGMNVNRLTRNLETVAEEAILYRSPQTVEYYKELKIGGFVALTYTPFSIKTNKIK